MGDVRVPLAQLGRDFAIATEPVELQPGNGEVLLTVEPRQTACQSALFARWREKRASSWQVRRTASDKTPAGRPCRQ